VNAPRPAGPEPTPEELRAAVIAAHWLYDENTEGVTIEGVQVCNYDDDEESFVQWHEELGGYYVEAFVFVPAAQHVPESYADRHRGFGSNVKPVRQP